MGVATESSEQLCRNVARNQQKQQQQQQQQQQQRIKPERPRRGEHAADAGAYECAIFDDFWRGWQRCCSFPRGRESQKKVKKICSYCFQLLHTNNPSTKHSTQHATFRPRSICSHCRHHTCCPKLLFVFAPHLCSCSIPRLPFPSPPNRPRTGNGHI